MNLQQISDRTSSSSSSSRRTQAVKGVDPKSTGLCPRRFESCRLRPSLSALAKMYGQPGSNRRSHACEACVLTTRRCPLGDYDDVCVDDAGAKKQRSRQDSNLRGQSPVDFWSTPLTAWVRLLLLLLRRTFATGRVAQWKSVGLRIQRLQVRVLPRSTFSLRSSPARGSCSSVGRASLR